MNVEQWISVDDRLPEPFLWVLVYSEGAINCMGWAQGEWQDWLNIPCNNVIISDITHWMPLPDRPEERPTNGPLELGLLVQREPSKHTMRHDLRAWQLDAVRDLTNLVEKRLREPQQVPVDDGMRAWGERAAKVLRNNGQFGVSALADEWDDRWGS